MLGYLTSSQSGSDPNNVFSFYHISYADFKWLPPIKQCEENWELKITPTYVNYITNTYYHLVDTFTFTVLLSMCVGYALASLCCGLRGRWKRSCSDSPGQGVWVLASRLLKSSRRTWTIQARICLQKGKWGWG